MKYAIARKEWECERCKGNIEKDEKYQYNLILITKTYGDFEERLKYHIYCKPLTKKGVDMTEYQEQVSENELDLCPMCQAKLIPKPGFYTDEEGNEQDYDGVVCPTGCDLWGFYEC